jgi:hypothetical protein
LPSPEISGELAHGVDLYVAVQVAFRHASTELSRALSPVTVASRTRVAAVSVQPATGGRLGLAITIDGPTCGDVWLTATPAYDAVTSRIRLREARLVPGAQVAQLEGMGLARSLENALERHGAIALPVDIAAAPASLETMVQSLGAALPKGVRVGLKLAPGSIQKVSVAPEGLIALAVLQGDAELAFLEP